MLEDLSAGFEAVGKAGETPGDGAAILRQAMQFQAYAHNDAQRTFRADKQLLNVRSGGAARRTADGN